METSTLSLEDQNTPSQTPLDECLVAPRLRPQFAPEEDHDLEADFPPRKEKREHVFRVAEYSLYPRSRREQRRLSGFIRNESRSGLCLVSKQTEGVGSCLRIGLQGVDGIPTRDVLARVVWAQPQTDGRHWLGLTLLDQVPSTQTEAIRTSFSRGDQNEASRPEFQPWPRKQLWAAC